MWQENHQHRQIHQNQRRPKQWQHLKEVTITEVELEPTEVVALEVEVELTEEVVPEVNEDAAAVAAAELL